jgi:hypothetical protein
MVAIVGYFFYAGKENVTGNVIPSPQFAAVIIMSSGTQPLVSRCLISKSHQV